MVEWLISEAPVGYPEAVAAMEAHVAAMQAGKAGDRVWLLEHPPLYTAGTSAREADLLQPGRFPVYRTGRGGQYTYHGPGQRVGYAMLDLRPRGSDLRRYVHDLEEWIIRALARFNVRGERRPGRIGIWVSRPGYSEVSATVSPSPPRGEGAGGEGLSVRQHANESIVSVTSAARKDSTIEDRLSTTTSSLGALTREAPSPLPPGSSPGQALSPGGERESSGTREDKIAAIGVRVRRWIAFHGIAVNLDPDLSHFQGIVPCGIAPGPDSRFGVTSLHDLGILASMAELDMALKGAFSDVFGVTGGQERAAAQ